MKYNTQKNADLCPCESGKLYKDCCQPYIEMHRNTPTAELLMRSRYSAFVMLDEKYLRFSWHPDTCPKTIHLHKNIKWLGLSIKTTSAGSVDDEQGTVEFVARSKLDGKATRLHEVSHFIQFNHRWVYFDSNTQRTWDQ